VSSVRVTGPQEKPVEEKRTVLCTIIDDVRLFGKGPRKENEVCDWESIVVEDIFTLVKLHTFDGKFEKFFLNLNVTKKVNNKKNNGSGRKFIADCDELQG